MSDNNKYDTMPFPFDSPSPLPVESDGGPAFPGETWGSKGMSLRDYFAGQALAGMQTEGFTTPLIPSIAKRAYVIADAMLAERQKERE